MQQQFDTHISRARSGLATKSVLFLVVLLVACSKNATSPQFQPEITNATDNFQFQVTGINNLSQTLQYTWQNTGTVANVNQSCSVTGGTATLIVTDGAGKQVYARDLRENGTFATGAGTTGNWTIQAILTKCSGTLNFRVQKR